MSSVTTTLFNNSMKLEAFTVPSTGMYHFQVRGAQGGKFNGKDTFDNDGGTGAVIECYMHLTQGDKLHILCGLFRNGDDSGYGGGGSFVTRFVNNNEIPLIVAGGGGVGGRKEGHHASLTESGTSVGNEIGGTNGQQGSGTLGGAGIYGDASSVNSFINGGLEGGGARGGGGGYSGGAYDCMFDVF